MSETVTSRRPESTTAFDPGLRGEHCWLELATGERIDLPVRRWRSAPESGDEVLLRNCTGPTLDVGCGPGRLIAALTARGVPALGIDVSPVAVGLARQAGAAAVERDVFDRRPDERRWRHVLLADGNVGIGGDPIRLLHRVRQLLLPGGTALVETDGPGTGIRSGVVRVASRTEAGDRWFGWAWLGADAVSRVAHHAGMTIRWIRRRGTRYFAELGV